MNDDLLKAATRALREQAEDDASDGRFTRGRVMASLHQGKVKRRTRLAFVLPIAACLAAGTAWGAATGRLPEMFREFGSLVSRKQTPVHSQPVAPRLPQAKPAPLPSAVPPEANPTVPVELERSAPEPAPSVRTAPLASASAPFHDADGDLYRLAHEAHFVSHDYARALTSWDAYLRSAPGGRFATEARYNRAICLLRLGREAEARQALEPFASGKLGYRQSEARELLDALTH